METGITYISSDRTEKDVREMNSSYLVNAFAKSVRFVTIDEVQPVEAPNLSSAELKQNVEVCKKEILRRIALGEETKTA